MSLKELRSRIKSVKSTQKITAAMKMVASAKLKRVQDKVMHGRDYLRSLEVMGGYIGKALQDTESASTWLKVNGGHDLLVIFGANKGLCGSFHGNLQRHAFAAVEKNPNAKLLVIGNKIKESLYKKYKDRFVQNVIDDKTIDFKTFMLLAEHFEREKNQGKINQIHVVSSHLKSVLVQEFQTKMLCPFNFPINSDTTIFEPSVDVYVPNFFKYYVAAFLYQNWIETNAGEVASRMTAMDNATRNASDMIDSLSMRYNRTRQAKITTELIEIISGYQSING